MIFQAILRYIMKLCQKQKFPGPTAVVPATQEARITCYEFETQHRETPLQTLKKFRSLCVHSRHVTGPQDGALRRGPRLSLWRLPEFCLFCPETWSHRVDEAGCNSSANLWILLPVHHPRAQNFCLYTTPGDRTSACSPPQGTELLKFALVF